MSTYGEIANMRFPLPGGGHADGFESVIKNQAPPEGLQDSPGTPPVSDDSESRDREKYAAGGQQPPQAGSGGNPQWREELHPRDQDGKFARAGRVRAAVAKVRKGQGQESQLAAPNYPKADHPSGAIAGHGAVSPGQGIQAPKDSNPAPNVTTDFSQIHRQFPPANPHGQDTQQKYVDQKTGQYTPERMRLHEGIVSNILGGVTPSSRPTVYMLGGGSASGKSTAVNSGRVILPTNAAKIDSDAIKDDLPEYQAQNENGDATSAAYNHEESSDISKMATNRALSQKMDIIMDGTGDSSFRKLKEKVEQWRAAGHRISANYMTVPTNQALQWSAQRAAKTGRMVPPKVIRDIHASVSRVVPQALQAGLYDDFKLWDNSTGKAVLVASAEGTNLQVHDQAMWDSFLGKAHEGHVRKAKSIQPAQRV